MDLTMTSEKPIQKNYASIPRLLYPEVKGCIEDLLNRGFIKKSKSPYSRSVVCVRKKDGGIRLCVDYRELNQNTVHEYKILYLEYKIHLTVGAANRGSVSKARPIVRDLWEQKDITSQLS